MPHPWDLLWSWRYSTELALQLRCLIAGILGEESARYARLELEQLEAAQRAPRRRARL